MNNVFNMYLPVKICCGEGSVDTLSGLDGDILIVSQKPLQGVVAVVEKKLTQVSKVKVLYLPDGEPTCSFIDETVQDLRRENIDYIVAVGGGSVIDTAKALAITYKNIEPVWAYANLSYRPPISIEEKVLPVISVPTTAGTGAEVTPYAVLVNDELSQKGTIQDEKIFPFRAILEPSFYQSLPQELTAITGIDALAHTLEAFINISRRAPVAEWAALEAISIIVNNLPKACKKLDDLDSREKMAWGSALAGIAISHRGTAVPHAIAEPLGALTGLPHGLCVSLVLMPVLHETWKSIQPQLAKVWRYLGNESVDEYNDAQSFMNLLDHLYDDIGISRSVSDYLKDVDDNLVETVLDNVLKYKYRPLGQHPVTFSEEQLKNIIQATVWGYEWSIN